MMNLERSANAATGAPRSSNSKPEPSAHEWVSVAVASARLNLSEKTVRKRIQNGLLESRRVSLGRGGAAYQVRFSLPNGTKPAERNGTETEAETEHKGERNGTETELFTLEPQTGTEESSVSLEPKRKSERNRNGTFETETEVRLLRDALESERQNSAFLKTVIEGLQQSEATTKAALREALKITPRQLPEHFARDAGAPFIGGATSTAPDNTAPKSKSRGAALSYGDIADMIEQELSQ